MTGPDAPRLTARVQGEASPAGPPGRRQDYKNPGTLSLAAEAAPRRWKLGSRSETEASTIGHVWANPAQILWHGIVLALFAVTLVEYQRRRTPHHRDAAILFATFGIVALSEVYRLYLDGGNPVLHMGFDLGLVVYPYAMARVIDHVRPVHPVFEGAIGVGALAGVGAVLTYGSLPDLPPVVFELLLAYFVGVTAYLTYALVSGAGRARGPVRNRLILAAAGSLSLILAALFYGAVTLAPGPLVAFEVADDLLVAAAFTNYYLGFATPEPLTRWWRSAELQRFLARSRRDDPGERIGQVTVDMCRAASRLLDAEDVLYLEPAAGGTLEVRHRLRAGAHPGPLPGDGLAGTSLADGESRWAAGPGELGGPELELARSLGGPVAVAVPVEARDRRFGVVLAFLQRRPLFSEGSVGSLELIAEEVALLREQEAAIEAREAERRRILEAEKKAAQESERLKDEFLATMSHEIRTPMNSILGMANLLQEQDLEEEAADFVDTIEESGEHLLTIIDDILDLSKLEAGHLRLEPEPVDVRDLVRSTADLVAEQARSKGLDLDWHVAEDVPETLSLDPHRMRQILLNLLSNGVKFTEEGGVEVRVDARGHPDDLTLVVEVEDSGSGIPEDQRESMFEAFQQGDASRSRRHEGTGLGLKISRELVELMGGSIDVHSTVGEGTTFRFTVPTERAAPTREEELPDPSVLEGMRVLVVDDPPADLKVAVSYLRDMGLDVDGVTTLREGLEACEEDPRPDLVVVDGYLDDEGQGAVESFRATHGDLPLLVLGTNEAPPDADEADAVLFRPYDRDQLEEALLETVARTHRGGGRGRTDPGDQGWSRDLAEDHPLRILVVEDNPVNRKVVLETLERFGYDPAVATDGEEALEAVQGEDFDLVFMDVQMPVMDGLEATRRIREATSPGDRPRIVGLSAHAGAERAAEAREAGMDDYLEKPIQPPALRAALTGIHDEGR